MKVVYIQYLGINSDGKYEYELLLSEKPEIVWGEDWAEQVPSCCGDMKPDDTTYEKVYTAISDISLNLVQNNSCFSMQDCIDGIIKMAWFENDEGNLVGIKFGEDIEVVEKLFNNVGIEIIDRYDD